MLVSIQAMIFCEEPFCNGTDGERFRGSPESRNYNVTIRGSTLQLYTIPWLHSAPPMWQMVVHRHVKVRAWDIMESAERWKLYSGVRPSHSSWLDFVALEKYFDNHFAQD